MVCEYICPSCQKSQSILEIIAQRIIPYYPEVSELYEEPLFYHDTEARYYVVCLYCHHKSEIWEVGLRYENEDGWGTLKYVGSRKR